MDNKIMLSIVESIEFECGYIKPTLTLIREITLTDLIKQVLLKIFVPIEPNVIVYFNKHSLL
jgi:hypothetical protein